MNHSINIHAFVFHHAVFYTENSHTGRPDIKTKNDHSFQWRQNLSISHPGLRKYEPPHDKTNKMTFALSEDSDQPGHPPSLISLRSLHEETLGHQLPTEHTAKTLIRLRGCPGWSESLLGAQIILSVLSLDGSYHTYILIFKNTSLHMQCKHV